MESRPAYDRPTASCRSFDQGISTDDSLSYPHEGLVIRLRSKHPSTSKCLLRDLRKSEHCLPERVLIRHSPILKPKTSKAHSRRGSSGVRISGSHFDLPNPVESRKHIHRYPTMLMLKLMEAKKFPIKRKKVTPSPSLKFVNFECPVIFPEKPRRPVKVKRRPATGSHRAHFSACTSDSLVSVRQLTAEYAEDHARSHSPLPPPSDDTSKEQRPIPRKVVFTRRKNLITECSDSYYDQPYESYLYS